MDGLDVLHYSIPNVHAFGTAAEESGDDIASAKQLVHRPVWLVSRLNPRLSTVCRAEPVRGTLSVASSEFVALEERDVDWRYLGYVLTSEPYRQRLDSFAESATRSHQRAPRHAVYRFWWAWPPRSEQVAIASFLDRETARIDELLARKRLLIERLEERRSAVIASAVTRGLQSDAAVVAGLDPRPELQSTGIDWLGDVPAHWDVVPLRYRVSRIQAGSTPPTKEERYYADGSIPWFGPSSFSKFVDLTEPVKLLHESAVHERAARLFPNGATLLVTIGATLGKVGALMDAGSCNQQITAIVGDSRQVVPRFLTYQLKRLEETLRAIAPSATLPILSQGDVGDVKLALPPLPEQRAIVHYIDRETECIDAAVLRIKTATERLREWRLALITSAVTGQVATQQGDSE